MATADPELEKQLKVVGKQLSHPSDSVDELLKVLDKVEKLLLRVDQSPKKSMVDALKPSMNALIKDSLLKHSDIDVKVAVASCISEITRITAPDAPYTDDQMRDVFELIVSSFEDLADQPSRSYKKRASILETVSKVRSCVIMLDLECDELIVKMFEHFLKAVRDFHFESVFPSMESIMVLVIDESEEISVEMLKPLLASVKKDREGVLPIAHKLGKGVLLKAADKLKPYMMPALTSLGESLDMYDKVVAAVCEGTTANFENKGDNDSGLLLANECKLEKGSVDEAQQAGESKVTTASSDQVDQVVKAEVCPKEEVDLKEEVDPVVENRSPKSVMSNGVKETVKEEASVDQESKKLEEDKIQEPLSKEDPDNSDADKLAKEKSQTEKISNKSEKETDTIINSVGPSDSSHVESDKEVEKDNDVKEPENENERDNDVKELENEDEKDNDVKESENQNEKDNDVKESENEAAIAPETVKDKDTVQESSPKAVESKPAATADASSPSQSNSVPDDSAVQSKKKPVPQEVETVSPSKSGSPPDETPVEKAGLPKNKGLTREDTPEAQKQAGKKTAIAKEDKLLDAVKKSEDGDASSDSDAKPLKKSKSKSTKQSGKKPKQAGKKLDAGESDTKKPKPSGKNVDIKGDESDSDGKPLKLSVKKGEKSKIAVEEEDEQDSDTKPLKLSAKKSTSKKKDDGKKGGNAKNVSEKAQSKSLSGDDEMDISPKSTTKSAMGEKRKIAAEEEEEHDSDDKPLKLSAKISSKKKGDGKKRGNGKKSAVKDQAESLSGDDEMDVSPKSAPKSTTREGNSTETPVTSAKRKRSTGKDEASNTIKYDESLVGTKVKVWWPEDKMYYEGVVTEFYPTKKKHKVSYVDGDEETLNLKTQKWEILKKFSVRDDAEHNTEVQSQEGSPEIHKKKKSKTDPAASQEKIKDSAKKIGGVSSSGKSKGSTPKDNKSTQKSGGKSSDAAATTSKEAAKSKEDDETLKTSSKTKTVSKSKGKTPPSSKAKEPEDVKSTENTKGGSKSGKKRKKA